MEDSCKKRLACRCFLSSHPQSSSLTRTRPVKLLFFMVLVVLVSGFLAILGPNSSATATGILASTAYHSWLWRWSSSSSSGGVNVSGSSARKSEGPVGLYSGMVQVMGVQNAEEEKVVSTESVINGSSNFTVPLAVEDMHIQDPNLTADSDASQMLWSEAPVAAPSPSKSLDLTLKASLRNGYTNLEKLEAGLQRVRAAIIEAKNENQTQEDPDFVPLGPMYWNAKVFHRSFLEMERQFKVFVYEEGEHPVFHDGPCKSIYSMEGNFIHRMEIDGNFRTRDPEKAHVFFLPFSVAMMVHFVYVSDSHDFSPIRRTVIDYVNLIAGRYPYWNRSLGSDHFMLACHDWGPEVSFSVPYLAKNSIRALCNANTSEKFNPIKDVSFPEINLQTGSIKGFIGGPSPSKRPILAFFAGGLHGPIRPIVLEHWENKDEDIQVHRYLPKGVSYYEMMKKSKFCLCPSGYEVASPRVVEAFYTGCVPVLISDHYVPPFSDVLNWKSFSVEVPVREIPNLKRILMSISPRQYIRMQRRVVQIRRHFEVNSPPKRYDVFHMILHSIWLRRLNVRIRDAQLVSPVN